MLTGRLPRPGPRSIARCRCRGLRHRRRRRVPLAVRPARCRASSSAGGPSPRSPRLAARRPRAGQAALGAASGTGGGTGSSSGLGRAAAGRRWLRMLALLAALLLHHVARLGAGPARPPAREWRIAARTPAPDAADRVRRRPGDRRLRANFRWRRRGLRSAGPRRHLELARSAPAPSTAARKRRALAAGRAPRPGGRSSRSGLLPSVVSR